MKRITVWSIIPLLMLVASGCTLKGTVKQITDTTSNVTGTTSGHAWWNEDGLLLPEHKAIAFATYNEANLEQDVARGQGEYLTSMGSLLGVASDAQPKFQTAAQERFTQWGPADRPARLAQLRAISR
jgi:hypothetical protein